MKIHITCTDDVIDRHRILLQGNHFLYVGLFLFIVGFLLNFFQAFFTEDSDMNSSRVLNPYIQIQETIEK